MSDPIESQPPEQVGRDTFERYKEQAKAACLASLKILERGEVDKVYCEWHDDYVVRRSRSDGFYYSFYQVKTNKQKSKQWSLNELFGFYHRTQLSEIPKSLRHSFVGKLLNHTIKFEDKCEEVVFLTNKTIGTIPSKLSVAIKEDDQKNKNYKIVLDNFIVAYGLNENEISIDSIKEKLNKLSLEEEQYYLDSRADSFESLAQKYIYKYSEIELTYIEAITIIHSLLEVVEKKSTGKIDNADINPTNIDAHTAIELPDILNELSISKSAYDALIAGGDDKALKTASILNRILKKAGFNESLIEQAAIYKSKWDTWYRNNRHSDFSCELDLITEFITDEMQSIFSRRKFEFKELFPMLKNVKDKVSKLDNIKTIKEDVLLGGFFSILVKEY